MSTQFEVPPAIQLRRKTAQERQRLHELASFRDGKPECPAGTFVALTDRGAGCLCNVEGEVIAEGASPSSLTAYCFGDYTACPTWRLEYQRVQEGNKIPLAERSLARPRRELRPVIEGENIFTMDGDREGRDSVVRR